MNPLALLFMVPAVILSVAGLVLLKKGARGFSLKNPFNITLILGLGIYALSLVFYLFALRLEKLSVIYPLASFNYVLMAIVSKRFLNEKMTRNKWIGIMLIILGSFFIVQ